MAESISRSADNTLIAAEHAYCREFNVLEQLHQIYEDVPEDVLNHIRDRVRRVKLLAIQTPAENWAGVMAKARMCKAGDLFDVDPLMISLVTDLLAIWEQQPRITLVAPGRGCALSASDHRRHTFEMHPA
jgi:hypothetical protein